MLPYLRRSGDWGLDLRLAADLVPSTSSERQTICEVGFAATYWTPDQQLAHLTVNGASIRAGDLIASGTVSGRERHQRGSLIELSWNGDDPLELGAIRRSFLEDGDEIVLRGAAVRTGHPTIQLGEVRGTIAPAVAAGAVWT